MFKNKKFRARSRFKNPTHRIETIWVQITYTERKNSVSKQDNDKDTTNNTIITKCLTEECKDCSGFYRNKFIVHVLCISAYHKKSKIANSKPGHYSYDSEVEHSTVGVRHVGIT